MKFIFFLVRLFSVCIFCVFFYLLIVKFFYPILNANSVIFPYAINPFDICAKTPTFWHYIKLFFKISLLFNLFIILNSIFSLLFHTKVPSKKYIQKTLSKNKYNKLHLLVGKSFNNNAFVYITEKALYQNILITGTIGSGKTSSAMYPFCNQLINFSCNNIFEKIGMLVLDVKGNFYKQILEYARKAGREDDVIVIELNGKYMYNPLHKPNLSPQILANRLKTILLLFSPNNSESYWIDECEKVLAEAIKLCRLYNNDYVTFKEIHKLITLENYYLQKLNILKQLFKSGKLSKNQAYDLHSALTFFENEFTNLDPRVLSILKSEITRITNTFISSYEVLNTFSPKKEELNFLGFEDAIKTRQNCCVKHEYCKARKFI